MKVVKKAVKKAALLEVLLAAHLAVEKVASWAVKMVALLADY